MSELAELARRLRGWAEGVEHPGWPLSADLLAAAEVVERSDWRPIEPKKMDLEQGVVCAEWSDQRGWFVCPQMMTPGYAARRGYTHYFALPAPPEVKP